MAPTSRIMELTSLIQEKTAILDNFFASNNIPSPSLDENAPASLPIPSARVDLKAARRTIIEATSELQALVKGPAELLKVKYTENVSLHAIVRFNISEVFPVGEEATFQDISRAIGLSERNVKRILRHGMTNHLFTETSRGTVRHTGLTKLLAKDKTIYDHTLCSLEELWPPSTKVAEALIRWPYSEENTETAFQLANTTTKSMYQVHEEQPERGEMFGRGMSGMDKVPGYEPSYLFESYPWASIQNGIVVDVGGGHGSVMISLAERFPNLKCYVQDLGKIVEQGEEKLPSSLQDRVQFMECNFFSDQQISADIYYMRSILHNWPDKYSVQILRHLRPALKNGSRILVHELVLPKPGTVSATEEYRIRHMDIVMLQLLNSYQRDANEWKKLFSDADPRFEVINIIRPDGAALSVIEVQWIG